MLKEFFKKIYLVRQCEEKVREVYMGDEMKTPVHLCIGAEAIAAGVLSATGKNINLFGTYRNHALYLLQSENLRGFFAELYGRVTGCGKGKTGSMHMMAPEAGLLATSAIVASTIPLAVGSALTIKLQDKNKNSVVFFGDGATEEGVFYESINFASLQKLPVLFVCEDNELAIHAKPHSRRGFKSFEELIKPFDIAYRKVDGTNVTDVYETTQSILTEMKEKSCPGFIDASYLRTLVHVGIEDDFESGYREKPKDLDKFDPLCIITQLCNESDIDLESIKSEIDSEISKQHDLASNDPFPEDAELFTDVL